MTLPKRKHPRNDTMFTELSLGTARWSAAGGAEGDILAGQVMERAWNAGIRHFDTAPYYGSGLCELRLGAALAWKPRDEYVLSTKVGIDLDPFHRRDPVTRHYNHYADFSPICDYSDKGIRRSFETSLHRMGISSSEIAYMHGISICDGGIDAALTTGMPSLMAMRDEGYVRMVGVGANTPAIAMAFIERYDIDMLLFAGGFSLMDHKGAEAVLAECTKRGIGVLAASPFASGRYFAADNTPFREKLALILKDFGISENTALIRFGLNYQAVLSVLWSTKNPDNVDATIAAFNEDIPAEFWAALEAAGMLHFRQIP